MKIEDLMNTNPLSVTEDQFLTHARQVLRDNNMRAIPVLNEKNRLEGVLTRRGVLNITSNKSNITVKSYTKNTPIITPDYSVSQTGQKMIDANIDSLPVVESVDNPDLVGVITFIDIFNSLKELNLNTNDLVESIMTKKVEVMDADTPIQRCWRKILETGYSGFPVIKNKELIGIVTREDVLEAGFARFKREDDSKRKGKNSPPVERIMSTPLVKTTKNKPVTEVAEILYKKEIGRLPVVSLENENELIGIVDRYDIIKSYLR